jgi:hypothetical protein
MKFCLATHHKAGTHWSKYVISNYINLLLNGINSERVDYDCMEKVFFPVRFEHMSIEERKSYKSSLSADLLKLLNYDALFWSHFDSKKNSTYDGVDKVVFQCRNVLDFLVSKFHYDMKRINSQREKSGDGAIKTVYELHPKATNAWIRIVNDMVLLASNQPKKYMIISYENLKSNPFEFYSKLIKFFLGDVNDNALKKAIAFSTIENTRKDEKDRSKPIVGYSYTLNQDGEINPASFARSGKVGQFKDYMSDSELKEIKSLVNNSISKNIVTQLGWKNLYGS